MTKPLIALIVTESSNLDNIWKLVAYLGQGIIRAVAAHGDPGGYLDSDHLPPQNFFIVLEQNILCNI